MLKKVGAVALIATLGSVIVATTAWGSAKAPRTAAAATASVKCGKRVSIGVAYPATGGVAFLGALQFDWAKYALKRWNSSHKLKIKFVPGDTRLTTDAAANVAVAHSFASNGKVLAVSPRGQPGGTGLHCRLQGGRSRTRFGLGDPHLPHPGEDR